jgi:hypothetical protein
MNAARTATTDEPRICKALDYAYAVLEGSPEAMDDRWWDLVWPQVQRVEASMRAGRTVPSEDERLLEIAAFTFQCERATAESGR